MSLPVKVSHLTEPETDLTVLVAEVEGREEEGGEFRLVGAQLIFLHASDVFLQDAQ